ncbi:MAG: hypothetical protein JF595_11045 [Sphingomonadales bacterium]|nr:hypothetical protein [Sphingomonadales bacterium]
MRALPALLLPLALAACSPGQGGGDTAKQAAAAEEGDSVACALDGAKDFAPACTREVTKGADGEVWVVRHPDGGFRRFVLIDKGTRIATADGAEEVQTDRRGAELEVRVARDRYLFPAAPEAKAAASDAPAS